MDDGSKPSWWRPASGTPASGRPGRSLAHARADAYAKPSESEPHPGRERTAREAARRERDPIAAAYADWLLEKGMRIFGTINTLYPLSIRQHIEAGRLLQDLYQVACGERPTVMVPCQKNPTRDGYHSHPSLFGSEKLFAVRRKVIWAELMSRLSHEPGSGVTTVSMLVTKDRRGQVHYRQWWAKAEEGWELLSETNHPRVRLEPVRSWEDALGYATRYGSRETDFLEVLKGDNWRS